MSAVELGLSRGDEVFRSKKRLWRFVCRTVEWRNVYLSSAPYVLMQSGETGKCFRQASDGSVCEAQVVFQ